MDSFKQTVALYTVGGSGTALNFVLLYLISTDKAKGGDGYRRMLAIVTVFNVYYAFVHCVCDLVCLDGRAKKPVRQGQIKAFIIDESGFLVFSKNLHKLGFWYSYVMTTVYIIAFEMSLSLLGIHCFYRYAKITGKYSSIFEKWYMILLVVIGYFVIAIIYGLNCALDMAPSPASDLLRRDELRIRYNVSIDGLGYMGPVYKLKNPQTGKVEILFGNMLGSLSCLIVQMIIFTVICACGWKLSSIARGGYVHADHDCQLFSRRGAHGHFWFHGLSTPDLENGQIEILGCLCSSTQRDPSPGNQQLVHNFKWK
ncbi:unnamed protein product, partial [Mesorhabditis belari]|uniref:Uncharacterized protein n=1 Tax=Mesorhabditis belari TaxID=2138241 RepID=A0AAF3F6R2_9BILA